MFGSQTSGELSSATFCLGTRLGEQCLEGWENYLVLMKTIFTESKGVIPPRITDSLPLVFSDKGTTSVLPCVTQGNPLPVTR